MSCLSQRLSKDTCSVGRDYTFPGSSPLVVLPGCSMLLVTTVTIMIMVVVVGIMMMVIIMPTEHCCKTITTIIITFATAQKWLQRLQPGKIPILSLLWNTREKCNKKLLKGTPPCGPASQHRDAELWKPWVLAHLHCHCVFKAMEDLANWEALQAAGQSWRKGMATFRKRMETLDARLGPDNSHWSFRNNSSLAEYSKVYDDSKQWMLYVCQWGLWSMHPLAQNWVNQGPHLGPDYLTRFGFSKLNHSVEFL